MGRSPFVVLAMGVILSVLSVCLSAQPAEAATFACEIRIGSTCLSNQTLLIRLNSSESGSAPNNSHAQLANYSGGAYNWSVCCWTDAFRVLNNSCFGNGFGILRLNATSNSHVKVGNESAGLYPYGACLNITGTLSCEYPNSACSSGYTGILSMASSETGDANLTNAHLAEPGHYLRQVCCRTMNTPPTVLTVLVNSTHITNTTAHNVTSYVTAYDPDQENISLTHDWRVNNTPLLIFHVTFDRNGIGAAGGWRDYSYLANNGTNGTNTLWNATGGYNRTGAIELSGVADSLVYFTHKDQYDLQINFTIDSWVKWTRNTTADGSIVSHYDSFGLGGWFMSLTTSGELCFDTGFAGGCVAVGTPTDTWMHLAVVRNGTNYSYYKDGVLRGSKTIASIPQQSTILCVGAHDLCLDGLFNGTIDTVRIWNRSLSAQQIRALYENRTDLIVSQELQAWQNWTDCVIANDGYNDSDPVCASHQVRAKVPPSAPTLLYPGDNNNTIFERFVNFSWSQASETDGDTVTYSLSLQVTPGSCSVETYQSSIAVLNYTYGELCVDQTYNWTVSACDVDGCSSNATQFNFTVASVVSIRFLQNSTSLGTFDRNQTKATDIAGILGWVINNTGNVRVNLTINATNNPFSSVSLPTISYQYKAGVNLTASYDTASSQTTYYQFNTSYTPLAKLLNYSAGSGANTTILIDLNVTAPMDEPPGTKTGNVTVLAEGA